jgi:ferric-dicitrate binding protein FerR (iron transport regulator)
MNRLILVLVAVFVLMLPATALAQEKQPTPVVKEQEKPAATAARPEILKIEGDCEYRASAKASWTAGKTGLVIANGAFLCTGFESKVTVTFPDDSKVEIGSLTEVQISTSRGASKELVARLKVSVGSVRVHVKEADIRSDFQVSTPHTTTSVKGTDWEVVTSYYGDKIKVHKNKIKATNKLDRTADIDEENETDEELQPTAQIEREKQVPPTVPLGHTKEETESSTVDPANSDQSPVEQTDSTNPDKERQGTSSHSY